MTYQFIWADSCEGLFAAGSINQVLLTEFSGIDSTGESERSSKVHFQFTKELVSKITFKSSKYNLNTISPIRESYRSNINQRAVADGAVVSFGSGGDILNPITSFVSAKEYHLVDILTGWGAGPGEVVLEVRRRLEHISANNSVKIVNKGFTEFVAEEKLNVPKNMKQWDSNDIEAVEHFGFPQEYWSGWGWPNKDNFNPSYLRPLIFEFKLANQSSKEIKRVYLHHLDYQNSEHLENLTSYLGKAPLKAIFLTGAAMPKEIGSFIDILRPNGYFVFELFAQDIGILDVLKNEGNLKLFPPHMQDYKKEDIRMVHFQKD